MSVSVSSTLIKRLGCLGMKTNKVIMTTDELLMGCSVFGCIVESKKSLDSFDSEPPPTIKLQTLTIESMSCGQRYFANVFFGLRAAKQPFEIGLQLN